MRVLFTSTRGAGHLQPLLPYAAALRARGHEVRVAAPASVGPTLAKAELTHAIIDHPGDENLAPLWQRMNALPKAEQAVFAVDELFAGIVARTAMPKLIETIRSFRPEVVVRESAELAALVAAEAERVPHARVAVHLPSFEELHFAPSAAAFDQLRERASLAPDHGASLRAEPVFTAFPASLEDPTVALTGRSPFRARMPSPATTPTSARWAATNDGRPLVYVTFGTIAGGNPQTKAGFMTAVKAVAELPVRVLLTTGPAMPVDALGAIPANMTVEAWVPQVEVLPHAALVVCHGGSGTTLGALAAGVPLVITPFGADQPYNAQQVARAGAGLAVVDADAASLRDAIVRALANADLTVGARRIGDEMGRLPTLDAAAAAMCAV